MPQKAKRKSPPGRASLPEKPSPRRSAAIPASGSSGERICWRFAHVDHDGPWGFEDVGGDALCEILKHLASLESMTVREVFPGNGYPGKDYDVAAIPTESARNRLDALGLADMTKISVLRLGGQPRLYGFRHGNVFHVVWWDPDHEIWPSLKKHT